MDAKSSDVPVYSTGGSPDDIIARALALLNARLKAAGPVLGSPDDVRALLRLEFGKLDPDREHFVVLYLDSAHALVETRVEFQGTVTQTSVYPREIAKRTLALNSSAVLLAHNHPSGSTKPSSADVTLTRALKNALELVDVRVLDHFVVGHEVVSMAQMGLV